MLTLFCHKQAFSFDLENQATWKGLVHQELFTLKVLVSEPTHVRISRMFALRCDFLKRDGL